MIKSSEKESEYWFIFQDDHLLLLNSNDGVQFLTSSHITVIKDAFLRQHALGKFNQVDVYCAEVLAEYNLPSNIEAIPFRKALSMLESNWYDIAAKAYAIIQWDKNHQYCGRCGNTTLHKSGTFERICTFCSQVFYPRISPSIIVLINKADHILMARSPHFTPGAYGLIAGFVEAGENCEAAVHREVKEEVGINIKHLHYFGSQAWPFPDSLMLAFTAEYDSGDIVIDPNEIETAGWYHFDNLPGRPSYRISMATKLIDHFIAQHNVNRK